MPAPEGFYNMTYYASDDPQRGYGDYTALHTALQRTMTSRMRRIERYLPQRGRLLDVGCGMGAALRVAHQRGWQAAGTEIAPDVVTRLRAQDLDVRQARAEDLDERAAYDCITMWDALEHVCDVRAACAAAARALRPGGVLALTTGDRGSLCARLSGRAWHLYNIPEHRFFFTAASIRRLLARVGLQLVSLRRRGSWYPLQYLCERLERKYSARLPVPRRMAAVCVYVNLWDIMEVHARKRKN